MAESGKVRVEGKQSLLGKLDIDTKKNFFYNDKETVSIRSLIDAEVRLTGAVSGTLYVWSRSGAEVAVDILDKDEILNKKRGRACCGGKSGKALFELV